MKVSSSCALAAAFWAMLIAVCSAQTRVGGKVDDFSLHDYLGTKRALSDWRDKKAVGVAFLGVECPLTRHYGARLAELAAKYGPNEVAFVGIDSNQQDALAEIAHYAKECKIDFPILKDAGNVVADKFGAQRTPEVFVVDAQRTV